MNFLSYFGIHTHEYIEVNRVTVQGISLKSAKNISTDDLLMIQHGKIEIELKCEICGDIQVRTLTRGV